MKFWISRVSLWKLIWSSQFLLYFPLLKLCFRDRFRDGYESLRKAFEAVDTNRDGYISRKELQQILFDFHYFLEDYQLNILLER